MTVELTLKGELSLQEIERVAREDEKVKLGADARTRLASMRAAAAAAIEANPDAPIYGFNRGFGSNILYPVGHGLEPKKRNQKLVELQANLILSHTANMGPLAPREIVRATMLLRAQSLALGRSTVRPIIVETLIDMLNAGVTPAVPRYGSVSASGDLAPLSHIAAVMIGKGRVLLDEADRATFGAESVETERYLREAPKQKRFALVEGGLQMKEGLALNNGCQWSTAWGVLTANRMRVLIETAALATALGVQAMLGVGQPFKKKLHDLRPHPSSRRMAAWIDDLLAGYAFRDLTGQEKAVLDGDIQDPYNLRCAAQILGPCLALVERAEETLAIEANSVTDNPIDLNAGPARYRLANIVSGGHFHGMPVAVDIYGLLQAAGIMARLSNMRCVRYVDSKRNKGLGPQLRGEDDPDAAESGMLIAEYATAGLCNHIWGLAMPSHLMSLSTDSGQEDHVSMAANVAMRAHEAAERLADVLAIELAFASHALWRRDKEKGSGVWTRALDKDLGSPASPEESHIWPKKQGRARRVVYEKRWRTPLSAEEVRPSPLTVKAIRAIRETFKILERDNELSWDMMKLAEQVLSGKIASATGYNFGRH